MIPTAGLSGFNSTSSRVLLPCASPWRIVLKAVLSFPGKLIFNFSRRGGLQGSRIRIKRARRSRGDKGRKLKIQRANKRPRASGAPLVPPALVLEKQHWRQTKVLCLFLPSQEQLGLRVLPTGCRDVLEPRCQRRARLPWPPPQPSLGPSRF